MRMFNGCHDGFYSSQVSLQSYWTKLNGDGVLVWGRKLSKSY